MINNELTLPEGLCSPHKGSLKFHRTPTEAEWEQVGRFVYAARSAACRWRADWARLGRREFGDLTVQQFTDRLQMEFPSMKAAEALEAFEIRSDVLSDEHHCAVVKALPDGLDKAREEWQQKAQEWLLIAEKEELSPRELQKSIKAGKVVREDQEEKPRLNANDRSVGLVTIEGVHMQFNLWLKKVREDDGFPAEWDARRLRMVRDLLAPMAEIRSEIGVMILEKGGEV
jgi:hypothetical protein